MMPVFRDKKTLIINLHNNIINGYDCYLKTDEDNFNSINMYN